MGNCLKGASTDDISLLRGNEGADIANATLYRDRMPLYYPEPNDSRPANQLSEEEQVKIARRMGLMQHLPILAYDDAINKHKECVICMVEFKDGERVRYLPCVHVYHVSCIDDWLMRSFTCPSCMEPVDAALLTSYNTNNTPTTNANNTTPTTSDAPVTTVMVTPTTDTTTTTTTSSAVVNTSTD